MSDVECARMLIDAAGRDFDVARAMRHSEDVSDEVFGFHVQQAADKSLKVWLALPGRKYPLIRDIEELFDFLVDVGADAERFRILVDYTLPAVEFRYHDVDSGDALIDRGEAVVSIEGLFVVVPRELAPAEGA